ncbi:MAG: hypothetical protein L6R36_001018 [Xanthoria steineri]|nr:MAG: hypothetical protein L6R36_001018 [Xanthoria steineri]
MEPVLSLSQLHALEVTERVASVLSLLAAVAIILTFVFSPKFRKPVNRLIFYASWGNLFANAATLISRSGVRAGPNSALCQFQAFLIQMFFIADALWNLAMAINVYLNVLKKYNAEQLKAMEWRYHLLCYGTPFVIALIFCFIETQGRGRMYGPAQLWCWISSDWAFMRIALFYAPAWICIAVSLTLYVISGLEMARKRDELRAFHKPSRASTDETFPAYKTTEIDVTSEVAGFPLPRAPAPCFDAKDRHPNPAVSSKDYEPFSTTISSSPPTIDLDPSLRQSSHETSAFRRYKVAWEDNKAAIKYTKVALLFFTSLCVTWIPSSINRIYDLAHPNDVSYALNFLSAIVLPLMGFWNGVIYFATTRAICANIFWDLMEKWAPRKSSTKHTGERRSLTTSWVGGGSSMTEGLVPMKQEGRASNGEGTSECHDLAGLRKDEERF